MQGQSSERTKWNKGAAAVYIVRGHAENFGPFEVNITIREWLGGGSLAILGDMGKYIHAWHGIGTLPFREFLSALDFHSFMRAAFAGEYMTFSPTNTRDAIQDIILESRRKGEISRCDARAWWEDLRRVGSAPNFHISGFLADLTYEYGIVNWLFGGDDNNVPVEEEPRQECLLFWEHAWPRVTSILREEAGQGEGRQP